MKKYIFIGIGGFCGAICRFVIKNSKFIFHDGDLPVNTLIINIMGSFILGMLMESVFEALNVKTDLRLGISIGFLGAFTTFSTLCSETAKLALMGSYWTAVLYVLMSTVFGLSSVWLGIVAGKHVYK